MSNAVFFSWQSDRPTTEGRNFIQKALETAVRRIAEDITVELAVREGLEVDKDTRGVPGSPPIVETILKKINAAGVFVPDFTFVGTRLRGQPTPNPNVLIEYGWALRCLTHARIVAVMNAAHGSPARDVMPFDLAHHRFPITYNLPDSSSDETRKKEQEKLARQLETALRAVLGSAEFKASQPKPPAPPVFKEKPPMNGHARFRAKGQPIGVNRHPLAAFTGASPIPVHLSEGPTMWLRVMPVSDIGRVWKIVELENAVNRLVLVPLSDGGGQPGFVRGNDGFGVYNEIGGQAAPSVVYAFTTGEVWAINTIFLSFMTDRIWLEERRFTESLQLCVKFLDELGVHGPYRWIAGMEDIEGRFLSTGDAFDRRYGPCMTGVIETEGHFTVGDDPAKALEPFFVAVFDQCGAQRLAS